MKFKTYAEVLTDFLARELLKLTPQDKCIDIFRNMNTHTDFEKLHQQLSNFACYKFLRTSKKLTFERLDIITRTGFVQGEQYITAVLQKYKIQKELFILNLENGHEVVIPPVLSQKKLPQSYRYYDPIA